MREITSTIRVSLALLAMHAASAPYLAFPAAPKREMRGAWIATVHKIDWPKTSGTEAQKRELTGILDQFGKAGLNAVFLQVRTECDALYPSELEPWSQWLTGTQGRAPSPAYDPLAFAVAEAHRRGMELHAWLNPYRAQASVSRAMAPSHVTARHPGWILDFRDDGMKLLDPGHPEVPAYVVSVVEDIVRRYDVDGIHFDDYFYPYSGIAGEDAATFRAHSRGFQDIADWRRDNVNRLVRQVHQAVRALKPHVKFGISPFGIWKSGVPAGITGLSAYDGIYADARAWLHGGSVDYVAPQLYWRFGGGQDYGKLMPWWAGEAAAAGRHLYTGLATYRIPDWGSASEITRQVRANRAEGECHGSLLYNAGSLTGNLLGIRDSLEKTLYATRALLPVMAWKDTLPPSPPHNVRVIPPAGGNDYGRLEWDAPPPAADGDSGFFYAVYRVSSPAPAATEFLDPSNIRAVVGTRSLALDESDRDAYFAVRSLDRNANESVSGPVAGGIGVSVSRLQPVPAGGLKVAGGFPGGIRIVLTGDMPLRVEAVDLRGKLLGASTPEYRVVDLRLEPGFQGVCIVRSLHADGRAVTVRAGASMP
jgi:uncharacterized lipoprotein YddW (UPF0748 family)